METKPFIKRSDASAAGTAIALRICGGIFLLVVAVFILNFPKGQGVSELDIIVTSITIILCAGFGMTFFGLAALIDLGTGIRNNTHV